MRTTILLHGALASYIGRDRWSVDIERPTEGLQAIEANSNGKLLDFFFANYDTEFRFIIDGKDVTNIEQLELGEIKEMHVLPVLKGSGGGGGWLAIIGIAIIALVLAIPTAGTSVVAGSTVATSGAAAVFGSATLTATASFFMTVGVALTLGGIAQMMAPTPNTDDTERPENKPSYIYNGAINTYRQGNPIPFGAGGPFICGSQVISAGIRSVDVLEN